MGLLPQTNPLLPEDKKNPPEVLVLDKAVDLTRNRRLSTGPLAKAQTTGHRLTSAGPSGCCGQAEKRK